MTDTKQNKQNGRQRATAEIVNIKHNQFTIETDSPHSHQRTNIEHGTTIMKPITMCQEPSKTAVARQHNTRYGCFNVVDKRLRNIANC